MARIFCHHLFACACVTAGLAAGSCRQDHPDVSGEVILYCSVDQAIAEPIVAEFEKRTGIRVRARYDTEAGKTVGLVQRLRAEARAPLADVFWSSEIFYTIRLAREGILAAYRSERTANWPGQFADSQGRWHGFALRTRVIAYNRQRVSTDEAPKRLEEALDPKWRGRIVMARPQFGTTGGDVASWFAHYGPGRAIDILRALKANQVRLVDGNSTAVRFVGTGQADICFTDTDDVHAAVRNGWPVAMHVLDQGGDGALTIPNTAALISGAPHPTEAAALLEFLLSPELEHLLAQSDSHNSPIDPAVAAKYADYAVSKPLQIDYEEVADHLETAILAAGEILQ